MIIHKTYKTYKDSYPLLLEIERGSQVGVPRSHDLNALFHESILALKNASTLAKYTYITRHTNDDVPIDILNQFKSVFPSIASRESNKNKLRIPTVWFTCYSDNLDDLTKIAKYLSSKDFKYFPTDQNAYEDMTGIPPDNAYTINSYESSNFPKFLHQVTQIGLNLLENVDKGGFLTTFKYLELRTISDETELSRLERELKKTLKEESKYYSNKIESNENEKRTFWTHFRIVHGKRSWPHFLFNICGK